MQYFYAIFHLVQFRHPSHFWHHLSSSSAKGEIELMWRDASRILSSYLTVSGLFFPVTICYGRKSLASVGWFFSPDFTYSNCRASIPRSPTVLTAMIWKFRDRMWGGTGTEIGGYWYLPLGMLELNCLGTTCPSSVSAQKSAHGGFPD